MSGCTEKELNYHVIKFLESLEVEDPSKRNALSEVTSKLSKLFEVNTKSVEDFLSLDYYHGDLAYHVENGVQALGAGFFDSDVAEAEKIERYKPFVQIIADRKYFDGCSEGSFEHLRRQSRVLSKFREKYPKTDLPIDHPDHPFRKALSEAAKARDSSTLAGVINAKSPEKAEGGTPTDVAATQKSPEKEIEPVPPVPPVPEPPASPAVIKSQDEKSAPVVPPPAPEPAAAVKAAGGKKKKGKK